VRLDHDDDGEAAEPVEVAATHAWRCGGRWG